MRLAIALLALAAAFEAGAENAFKCTDGQGNITYQQVTCPAGQAQRHFEFAPAPKIAPMPVAAAAKPKPPRAVRRAPLRADDEAPTSYECRVANGEVFYQHAPCPATVPGEHAPKRRGKRGDSPAALSVSGRALPRREACRRIHAAGAVTRAGHARDEEVSTYEKNVGRDPCR